MFEDKIYTTWGWIAVVEKGAASDSHVSGLTSCWAVQCTEGGANGGGSSLKEVS